MQANKLCYAERLPVPQIGNRSLVFLDFASNDRLIKRIIVIHQLALAVKLTNLILIYFSLSSTQRKGSKRKVTTDANPQLTWPHKAKHIQSQVPDGSHHPWTSTHSAITLNEFRNKNYC
jgi:quinol-cytochrome oxidoreductase complex cytochrome b subunit